MNLTLLQMALLMACGAGWRVFRPAGLAADQTRLVLTSLVYYLLLPALVLEVLWAAAIGAASVRYSILGVSSIVFAMFCMWLVGFVCKFDAKRLGAMVLAVIPNVTYLGLPVIEQLYGKPARSIVIQLDLFAAAPLVFTLGIMVARYYGENQKNENKPVWTYLNAPPFWAAACAVLLNLNEVTAPLWLLGVLQKLSAAVVPLMLFSMGLALSWKAVSLRNLPYVVPALLVKMLLLPAFAFALADWVQLQHPDKAVAVLDLAMPSMLLGVVFCDRYRLDSALYAMTVTITTALSVLTLPFWHRVLNGDFAF
jgi:predicted permease